VTSGIATKTLAEVYLSQGDSRKALEIYREILKREPSNSEIRRAIEDLTRKMARSSKTRTHDQSLDLTRTATISVLEQWREKIRTIRRKRKEGKPLE
jgi:hypothetical protein